MSKKHVTLVLTHRCNIACSYCYEHCKDAASMTLELAKRLLSAELNAENGFDSIEVDLFGGEPFMAFDVMRSIVSFLRNGTFKKDWSLSTITNGTVLTADMKNWLIENRDIIECVLSYDGTPEMQRINRGASTPDLIDLSFFAKTFPGTPLKMTVSKETLPHLAEGTIFLHEGGFLVNNSLANGVDWLEGPSTEELASQLGELVEYYLSNPDVHVCGMLHFPFEDIYTSSGQGIVRRPCDARSKTVCYDVDGRAYPCQQFLPMSSGGGCAKEVGRIAFPPETVPPGLLDESCRECPLSSVCQSCYGQNWLVRGSIYARDPGMCAIQKVLFKAKAYLAAQKWASGLYDLRPESEKALLSSIRAVDEM